MSILSKGKDTINKKKVNSKKNKSENIVEILNTVLVILNCMVSGPILYITFKIQE